jgi:hypothetical protein
MKLTHKGGIQMSHQGKVQLTIVFKATSPELVTEGDRIFESHAKWMASSHYRDGDKALLLYNVSKAPEYKNPTDPNSGPSGNTFFVLTEVYETEAGVADHWKQGSENWKDFGALMKWSGECETTVIHGKGSKVIYSLW